MIQMYTYIDVADNTGAKECMCVKVLGGTRRRYAGIGDVIIASVKKTSRALVVYEGVKTLGVGAEVSATIAESEAFDYLDAPIARLGGKEVPLPYNPVLEKAAVPQEDDIFAAALRLVKEGQI